MGYAEAHYGHFVLHNMWPYNPNLTIRLIASCLHNLERMDKHPLGDIATDGPGRSNVSFLGALNSKIALEYNNINDHQEFNVVHT